MRDDPTVVALVTRAAESDPSAWAQIVARYAPQVWPICARSQLSNQDAEDAGQNVCCSWWSSSGSAMPHIPVGSTGPQRARCLERLRRSHALTAFGEDDIAVNMGGGEPGA